MPVIGVSMRTFGFDRPNRLIAPCPIAILCILLLAACASNAIPETNKASDYTKQPKRLFVFETTSPQLAESSESFQSTMTKLLANCSVAMDYASRTSEPSLAFGDQSGAANQTKAQITQFRPDAILAVTFTSIRSLGSKTIAVDYLLELTDQANRKPVWKATVKGFSVGADLATRIVGRMTEEGILPPSCQPSTV
jgi:hypothetical protein